MIIEYPPKISLSNSEQEKLKFFSSKIMKANKKFNLTSLKSFEEIHETLIVESLETFNNFMPIKEPFWDSSVADLGSGAGIPGIPLKILNPQMNLTVVESNTKKTDFIKSVTHDIDISVTVLNERAEILAHKAKYREKFDIVVSRGVAKLNTLSELSIPFAKLEGKILSLKGLGITEEILNSEKAVETMGGELSTVLRVSSKSSIVAWKKVKPSPSKYPRKPGTPQKSPLGLK